MSFPLFQAPTSWPFFAWTLGIVFAVGASFPCMSLAQSHELRIAGVGLNIRYSTPPDDVSVWEDHLKSGLYWALTLGYRRFGEESNHGLLVEVESTSDPDIDSALDEAPAATVDITVVRGGYVHRRHWSLRRRPLRRSFALSLSVAGVAGYAKENWSRGETVAGVFGARIAVDMDVHFGHFFMGWTLGLEGLVHTHGALSASMRFSTNFQPWLRFGFTFGDSIHRRARASPL